MKPQLILLSTSLSDWGRGELNSSLYILFKSKTYNPKHISQESKHGPYEWSTIVFLPKVIEPGLAGHPPQSIPSSTFGTVPWFRVAWEEFTVRSSASRPNSFGSGWFLSLDIFAHPRCDFSDSSNLFSAVSDQSLAPFCQEFTVNISPDFLFSDPIDFALLCSVTPLFGLPQR